MSNHCKGSIMREWIYNCPAGTYSADSLISLVFLIYKHRLEHFFKGEGFVD